MVWGRDGKEESSEKMGWRADRKCLLKLTILRNEWKNKENNKDNVKETLKVELTNANDEKRQSFARIKTLKQKGEELVSLKAVAEANLANETKAENEAIKEFRSDLNAAMMWYMRWLRVENKHWIQAKSGQNEIKNLNLNFSKIKTKVKLCFEWAELS